MKGQPSLERLVLLLNVRQGKQQPEHQEEEAEKNEEEHKVQHFEQVD